MFVEEGVGSTIFDGAFETGSAGFKNALDQGVLGACLAEGFDIAQGGERDQGVKRPAVGIEVLKPALDRLAQQEAWIADALLA